MWPDLRHFATFGIKLRYLHSNYYRVYFVCGKLLSHWANLLCCEQPKFENKIPPDLVTLVYGFNYCWKLLNLNFSLHIFQYTLAYLMFMRHLQGLVDKDIMHFIPPLIPLIGQGGGNLLGALMCNLTCFNGRSLGHLSISTSFFEALCFYLFRPYVGW